MSVSGSFYVLAVFPIHRCPVGCVESVIAFYASWSIGALPVWPDYNLIKCGINLDLFQAWKAVPTLSTYYRLALITLLPH